MWISLELGGRCYLITLSAQLFAPTILSHYPLMRFSQTLFAQTFGDPHSSSPANRHSHPLFSGFCFFLCTISPKQALSHLCKRKRGCLKSLIIRHSEFVCVPLNSVFALCILNNQLDFQGCKRSIS